MADRRSGCWIGGLAARLAAEPDWRVPLGESLDRFYALWPDREAMEAALAGPPGIALLPFPAALLAAVAEQLAVQWALPMPTWVAGAGRDLVAPVSLFPAWLPADRLARHSPPAFSARRLLADPDPLRRARRPPLPRVEG